MNITIKPMTLEHLNQIKDDLKLEFDEFWNENVLKGELKNKDSTYIVAIDEQNNVVRICWNMATY